jgi:hypothetical protein
MSVINTISYTIWMSSSFIYIPECGFCRFGFFLTYLNSFHFKYVLDIWERIYINYLISIGLWYALANSPFRFMCIFISWDLLLFIFLNWMICCICFWVSFWLRYDLLNAVLLAVCNLFFQVFLNKIHLCLQSTHLHSFISPSNALYWKLIFFLSYKFLRTFLCNPYRFIEYLS